MSLGSAQTTERTATRRGVLAGGALAVGVAVGSTTARARSGSGGASQSGEPTERWTRAVTDPTNLVTRDGTYYLAAGERLQAVDATSGRVEWTASAGGRVPDDAMVLAADDTLVAATDAGTVVGVASSDGSERWRRTTGGGVVGLAVGNGRAYLATTTGVTALDPTTGEPAYDATPTDAELLGVTAVTADVGTGAVVHTETAIVGVGGDGREAWRVTPEPPGFGDSVFLFTENALATNGTAVYFQGKDGVNGWWTPTRGHSSGGAWTTRRHWPTGRAASRRSTVVW